MKKLIKTVNFFIIISVFFIVVLSYYEISSFTALKSYQKRNLMIIGELTLKALEGAPKYFGSVQSISLLQLAEELSKNQDIKEIIIFSENGEVLYRSDKASKYIPSKDLKPQEDGNTIILTRVLNPEDALGENLKGKLSTNFYPLYFATVIISKERFNRFISETKKDLYIIFTLLVVLLLLLIFIRSFIFKYEKLSDAYMRVKHTEEIANLSNMLAHEIKNPLSSIKGLSQHIYDRLEDDELADCMDRILDEINRLNGIVEEFNFFGKEMSLNKDTVSIRDIFNKALVLLRFDYEKKELNISMNHGDISVVADYNKLLQVIMNLLINAIYASPIKGSIEIVFEKNRVSIINDHNNDSLDPNRLFRPFYTTSSKGTGLGLAICKKIMDAHGFSIFVRNIKPFVIVLDFDLKR
ncbi:MAG: ATP-binding protein [Calditerrivibrio sp.]|nr:ATP-binding protein [Calditerrivibrio sp.]